MPVTTRQSTVQKAKKASVQGTAIKDQGKSKRQQGLAAGRNLRGQMDDIESGSSWSDFHTGDEQATGSRSVGGSQDDRSNPSRLSVAHSENSITPNADVIEPDVDLLLATPVANADRQEHPFYTCALPTPRRRHSFSGTDGDSTAKRAPLIEQSPTQLGSELLNNKRPTSTQPTATRPVRSSSQAASKKKNDERSPPASSLAAWLRIPWGSKKGNMNDKLQEAIVERDAWGKERDEALLTRDNLKEEKKELIERLERSEREFRTMYGEKELEVLRLSEQDREIKTRMDARIQNMKKATKAVERKLLEKETRRRRTEAENTKLQAKNVILNQQNEFMQRNRTVPNNTSFQDLTGTGNQSSVILENQTNASGQVSHSSRQPLRGQATLPNQPRQRDANQSTRIRTSATNLNGTGTLHQSQVDSNRGDGTERSNTIPIPEVTGNPTARRNAPGVSRRPDNNNNRSVNDHGSSHRSHGGDTHNRTRTTQLSSRAGVNDSNQSPSDRASRSHRSSRTQSRASGNSTARNTTAETLVTAVSSMHNVPECGEHYGRGDGGPPDPGGPDSSGSGDTSWVHPGDRSGARSYTPTPHPGYMTTPHRGRGGPPRRGRARPHSPHSRPRTSHSRTHSRRRLTGRFSAKHIREDHIFHGYPNENFEEWALKAKILCRLEAGSEDYFYSHLFFFLDGTPKQYYLQWAELDGHRFRTENVVRGLRAIYGDISNQQSRVSAYERMRQGSMTLFEFVTAFQVAFMRATPGSVREPGKADRMFVEFLKKVNPSEKSLVQQFMNGMNEPDWDELASRIRKNMRRYTEDEEITRPIVHTGVRIATPVERSIPVTAPTKILAGTVSKPPAPFMSEPTGVNRSKLCKYIQNTVKNGSPLTVQDLLEKLAGFSNVDVYYVVMACLDGSLGVEVRHTGMEAMTHYPEVFNEFARDAERERLAKLELEGSPVTEAARKFENEGSKMRRNPRGTKPGGLSYYADKSRRPAKPPPYFVCHTCKKKGHYRDECPEAPKEEEGKDKPSDKKPLLGLRDRASKIVILVTKDQVEPDWNVAGGPKSYATYLAEWAEEEGLPFPPTDFANLPEFLNPFDEAFPYSIWRERYLEWMDDCIAEAKKRKPSILSWTNNIEEESREEDTTPWDWEELKRIFESDNKPLQVESEQLLDDVIWGECFDTWTDTESISASDDEEQPVDIAGLFDIEVDNEIPRVVTDLPEPVTVPQNQFGSNVFVTAPYSEIFPEIEIFSTEDEIPIFDINTRLSNRTLQATVFTAAPDWETVNPETIIYLQPMEVALRVLDRVRRVQRCMVAALVDSGSALTVMQRSAYVRAGGRMDKLQSCKHKLMTGFGGDISILGRALMPFALNTLEFQQTVHIINDDERLPLIILGLDWLLRHRVLVDFETNIMRLYRMSIQLGKSRQKCHVQCLAGVDEGKEYPPKKQPSPYPDADDNDHLSKEDREAIEKIRKDARDRYSKRRVDGEEAAMASLLEEASDAMNGLQWALPEAWNKLDREQKDDAKEGLYSTLRLYATVAPLEEREGSMLTEARHEVEYQRKKVEKKKKGEEWRLFNHFVYDGTLDPETDYSQILGEGFDDGSVLQTFSLDSE